MSTTPPRTAPEVADALQLDLWNEHHYQITATVDFYAVLQRNLDRAASRAGDEASLTSALIHTRSLLEFYAPSLTRRHPDSIWWVTGLGYAPTDNEAKAWREAIGNDWEELKPWIKPIHIYLAHLSWARRSLVLPQPPDQNDQRWPLLDLTKRSLALLDLYVDYVRGNSALGPNVTAAVEQVQGQARDLWTERKQWAAREAGVHL
jgi:hypothetical protein